MQVQLRSGDVERINSSGGLTVTKHRNTLLSKTKNVYALISAGSLYASCERQAKRQIILRPSLNPKSQNPSLFNKCVDSRMSVAHDDDNDDKDE